ncbi:carbohydrate kinase family protein [Pendulispora brunnea]|uniref:Carbohydrate kinase family protein n=1 Tax=Pendulispora brunnea TaxID=2905690 RepID=A0ABZ2KIV7_9BACT
MKKVLVAGEINVDLVLRGCPIFPAPGKEVVVDDLGMVLGSASAICAMGLARLGTPVAFAGKVGDDAWGSFCTETMGRAGVDIARIVAEPGLKTGVTVAISGPSDRALVTFLGSSAELGADDIGDDAFEGAAHLHVSSYYLQQKLRPGCRGLFERAHRAGLTTSLDPGYDPSEHWADDLLATLGEVDLFFPNEVELRCIARRDDVVEALHVMENVHAKTVAKLGAEGAITLHRGEVMRVPAFPVQPVDTTGAGDSFNAGFLHAWLAGDCLVDSMRFGAACASLSTLGIGGTAAQATRDEALAVLRRRETD